MTEGTSAETFLLFVLRVFHPGVCVFRKQQQLIYSDIYLNIENVVSFFFFFSILSQTKEASG